MIRNASILPFCAALLACPAFAQSRLPTDLPGEVSPASVDQRDIRLSAAQRQVFAQKVDALFARLLATAPLRAPRGFAISRGFGIASPPVGAPPWIPARAQGHLLLRKVDPASGSRRTASGAYSGAGEGPGIRITVNDLAAISPFPDEGREDRPRYFDTQMTTGDFGGFPVIRFGSRLHTIIAKAGRAPFRHVTKAELIAREIDDLTPAASSDVEAQVGELKAELAAIPAAERTFPACRNEGRSRHILAPCGKGATYVVTPDFSYFERAKGLAAVQFVVIAVPEPGGVGHLALGNIARAAVAALDLPAIRASLE